MGKSEEKFRKLLDAYEDEVQRKQHRMGKRIEPTDEPRPDPHSGVCQFVRNGTQVMWAPSFAVLGTFDPATSTWTWGWAEHALDPRVRSRVEQARSQAALWGISTLTTPTLAITTEREGWELAIVASAILNADAMYKYLDPDGPSGEQLRFLALFDGPPPSRSTSLRAVKGAGREVVDQAMSGGPTYPAMARHVPVARATMTSALRQSNPGPSSGRISLTTPMPGQGQGLLSRPNSGGYSPIVSTATPRPPSVMPPAPAYAPSSGSIRVVPMPPPHGEDEREPTATTREELGLRLFKAIPSAQRALLGVLTMSARPQTSAPIGGAIGLDLRLVLKPVVGSELQLTPPAQLYEAVTALWQRCLDNDGRAFKVVTARLENVEGNNVTHIAIER